MGERHSRNFERCNGYREQVCRHPFCNRRTAELAGRHRAGVSAVRNTSLRQSLRHGKRWTASTKTAIKRSAVSPVVRYRKAAYLNWTMAFRPRQTRNMFVGRQLASDRLTMALLMLVYVVVCCLSSIYITQLYYMFHMAYDPAKLVGACVAVAAFTPVLLLFIFARFSFGYFVGFYFFSMFVGYLWLSFFSDYTYDRRTALLSALTSAVVFLLPALYISSPIKQVGSMSLRTFDRLLTVIFLLCLLTVAVGASYNFRFVNPGDASNLRTNPFPTILNYLIGITSSSLLPFLFACYLARKDRWRAGAVLVLLVFYYPVAVSKVAFFAPAWLAAMALLSKFAGARVAVVLSVLIPASSGVLLIFLLGNHPLFSDIAISFFKIVNLRMIAIPSIAMDVYNDFFAKHELTHFCQVRMLKPFIDCPYQSPLSIVMLNSYPFGGNFNASLFATEGIASVGLLLAPVSAFACGLVVALGNRLSAGLPPSFSLISGAIVAQILLNVPLTTVLLTHGLGLLFLLWYITPRSMFEEQRERAGPTVPATA
jgi:hypothetical protein